ncbi:immunity 26/phosphotriesterase HocA family protein, partial [Leptospira levettii]|uniref:immunity 26/phosphotriesterase HocA family protein n=1 Tax=Leptospira levettii TaxID=2023178 RepID=UPI001EEB8A78
FVMRKTFKKGLIMKIFELNNEERRYFGLNPVLPNWERVTFKGDALREDSILYYDGNKIKRQIISNDSKYEEKQYEENTINKKTLLPKTDKGKEKKLTPATFEKCRPINTYCKIENNRTILIGNYSTQRMFYNSEFDNLEKKQIDTIKNIVSEFIETCPESYINDIDKFNSEKRKKNEYKMGDFFRFKINRTFYGFGRILLDINKIRKQKLISEYHGLNSLAGPPVLIKIYAIISEKKDIELELIKKQISLPSSYIMDNRLFYGDYEIIGNIKLEDNELDFPISYGRRNDHNDNVFVFLQWGLIHLELPLNKFSKYLYDDRYPMSLNPYRNYAIGFEPSYGIRDIKSALEGNNIYDTNKDWYTKFDLRSPTNKSIKNEIMETFGLNPNSSYTENSKITKTKSIFELLQFK